MSISIENSKRGVNNDVCMLIYTLGLNPVSFEIYKKCATMLF